MIESLLDVKNLTVVTKVDDLRDPGLLRPVIASINEILVAYTNVEIKYATKNEIVIGVNYDAPQKLQHVINDNEMCLMLAKLLTDIYAKLHRMNFIMHDYKKKVPCNENERHEEKCDE